MSEARDLVFYYYEVKGITKSTTIPRDMAMAKRLLNKYPLALLKHAVDLNKETMYSLGYLTDKVMLYALKDKERTVPIVYNVGGDSIEERNRRKLQRQSDSTRFRTCHSFDMLKESREDSGV